MKIWDYSSLGDAPKAKAKGDDIDEAYDEATLKGALACVAVCRRGTAIPSSFGRLDVTALAFSRDPAALLVGGGGAGILLWSTAGAQDHAAAAQALLLRASAGAAALSGRRGAFATRRASVASGGAPLAGGFEGGASSLPVELAALCLQLLERPASSSHAPLALALDPTRPLLHVADGGALASRSLLALHLGGPSLRSPLPLVAHTPLPQGAAAPFLVPHARRLLVASKFGTHVGYMCKTPCRWFILLVLNPLPLG